MWKDKNIFGGRWGRWDRMTPVSSPKATAAQGRCREAARGHLRAHSNGPGSAQLLPRWLDAVPALRSSHRCGEARVEHTVQRDARKPGRHPPCLPFLFPSPHSQAMSQPCWLHLRNTSRIHPLLPFPSQPGVRAGLSFA